MSKNSSKSLETYLPLDMIDSEVKFIIDHCKKPLCVACSGGADSLALLMFVRCYWPKKEYIILHYNHRVRDVSEEEECRIKAFASALNLKIEVGHRLNTGLTTEESLRKDRYDFFEKMLRLHESELLLLGHHQDDLFETTLMRLVRGVGLDGVVAPKAIQPMKNYTKVRPLLNFKKDDLIKVCKQLNLEYFNDCTNQMDICVRNRIRWQILQKFNDIFNHNWRKGFASTCSILAEHRKYLLKKLTEKIQEIDFSVYSFQRNMLEGWDRLEIRHFLQVWFSVHGVEVTNASLLTKIVKSVLCDALITLNLNDSFFVKLDRQMITLSCKSVVKEESFFVKWNGGTLFFPNHAFLYFRKVLCTDNLRSAVTQGKFNHKNAVVVDMECLEFPLIVRNWLPGDRYSPIGKTGEKKLKDLFVDNKIKSKNWLPVISNYQGNIVWVPGLPPANYVKITPKTKLCVFLFYQNLEMV